MNIMQLGAFSHRISIRGAQHRPRIKTHARFVSMPAGTPYSHVDTGVWAMPRTPYQLPYMSSTRDGSHIIELLGMLSLIHISEPTRPY